jgi:MFS family permease
MTASSTPESTTAAARAGALAVGVVALEFAAAVSAFVSSTLLPTVARDLAARDRLGLLLAGATLGLFVALPLAPRVLRRLGPTRTLGLGLVAQVGGSVAAAAAPTAEAFAAGQLAAGWGGGVLAVFGISAIIEHLDGALRVRVVAASSAMWIVPALVGPPATLALEHAVGWRWALLLPVPVVLVGRLLVARAVRSVPAADPGSGPPLGRTLLVPLGVAALVLGSGRAAPGWWAVAAAGTAVGLAGVATLMPRGTARLRPGTPAALGAMLLFATGYFGADSMVTVLLTDGYGTDLARAAVVLGAAPLAWALTSLLVPRLARRGGGAPAVAGLALTAAGTAALAAVLAVSAAYGPALVAWTLGGVGVGLAYPGLYLLCTTVDRSAGLGAVELAAAVITAEAFGGLLGRAAGGATLSLAAHAGLSRPGGLVVTYGLFAALLAAAAGAARRAAHPPE